MDGHHRLIGGPYCINLLPALAGLIVIFAFLSVPLPALVNDSLETVFSRQKQAVKTAGSPCANLLSWQITLDVSGGFSGLRRTLQISSTGKLTAVDQKTGKKARSKLARHEADQLTSIVAAACPFDKSLPASRAAGCPDCLVYGLRISSGEKSNSVQVNDRTLPGSRLESLINRLMRILEQALSSQGNRSF